VKIACVGARETPPFILRWMEQTGAKIVKAGHTLVTGNASGADQAWARGGNEYPERVELCLPWAGFEKFSVHRDNVVRVFDDEERYLNIAAGCHPRWSVVSPAGRRLQARNIMILEDAVMALGYLDARKRSGGGTGGVKRAAERVFKIPFLSVGDPAVRVALDKFVWEGL
jgi:hypothetical protein